MFIDSKKSPLNVLNRFLSSLIVVTLCLTTTISPIYAQSLNTLHLPVPGAQVGLSSAYVPVLLKGMTIHPEAAFRFDFIVDSGHSEFDQTQVKEESERLVKYFLASMTVPQNDLWVNLSPYEDDRIIPEELGKTELGRDLLAQDYLLKQLSATLMYPEDELGNEFWQKIYAKAQNEYGMTDVPVNTFSKVWILPEQATVYEHETTVYITESKLKVMLDVDYQAMQAEGGITSSSEDTDIQSSIIREVIIPAIETEVNQGKNFAPLRQIYHSLILAKWYKEMIKDSGLAQVYVDQNKVSGIDSVESSVKDDIYERYIRAYKKGVFDYIKEDYDHLSQTVIPRKYFSGGFRDSVFDLNRSSSSIFTDDPIGVGDHFTIRVSTTPEEQSSLASSSLSVTSEKALDYQKKAGDRFLGLIERAKNVFNGSVKGIIKEFSKKTYVGQVLFSYLELKNHDNIKQRYDDVQKIIRDVLGEELVDELDLVEMDLDQIHVTISGLDNVKGDQKIVLTLEDLVAELRADAEGLKPFSVQFIGPYLLHNQAIVMEYTTSASEFFHLRDRAEKRLDQRRNNGTLSQSNVAFTPNIIHSTVSLIEKPNVNPTKLLELSNALNQYREQNPPIDFVVDSVGVAHMDESNRRFIDDDSDSRFIGKPEIVLLSSSAKSSSPNSDLQARFAKKTTDLHQNPMLWRQGEVNSNIPRFVRKKLELEAVFDTKSALTRNLMRDVREDLSKSLNLASVDIVNFPEVKGLDVHVADLGTQPTNSFKPWIGYGVLKAARENEDLETIITTTTGNQGGGIRYIVEELNNFYKKSGSKKKFRLKIYVGKNTPEAKLLAMEALNRTSEGTQIEIVGDPRKDGVKYEDYNEAFEAGENEAIKLKEKAYYVYHADELAILSYAALGEAIVDQAVVNGMDLNKAAFIIPVGAGGLASGVAIAAKLRNPNVKVILAQTERTKHAYESFVQGELLKYFGEQESKFDEDGIDTKTMEPLAFEILSELADGLVLVNSENIQQTIGYFAKREQPVKAEGAAVLSYLAMKEITDTLKVQGVEHVVNVATGSNIMDEEVDVAKLVYEASLVGSAELVSSSAVFLETVGGIDMNEIDVDRQGSSRINIQFDPIEMQEIMNMNIQGLSPVIINITPLQSVRPLLGLQPQRLPQREEEFEVSILN